MKTLKNLCANTRGRGKERGKARERQKEKKYVYLCVGVVFQICFLWSIPIEKVVIGLRERKGGVYRYVFLCVCLWESCD